MEIYRVFVIFILLWRINTGSVIRSTEKHPKVRSESTVINGRKQERDDNTIFDNIG